MNSNPDSCKNFSFRPEASFTLSCCEGNLLYSNGNRSRASCSEEMFLAGRRRRKLNAEGVFFATDPPLLPDPSSHNCVRRSQTRGHNWVNYLHDINWRMLSCFSTVTVCREQEFFGILFFWVWIESILSCNCLSTVLACHVHNCSAKIHDHFCAFKVNKISPHVVCPGCRQITLWNMILRSNSLLYLFFNNFIVLHQFI